MEIKYEWRMRGILWGIIDDPRILEEFGLEMIPINTHYADGHGEWVLYFGEHPVGYLTEVLD